jgi:hypothetical protein
MDRAQGIVLKRERANRRSYLPRSIHEKYTNNPKEPNFLKEGQE